MEIKRIKIDGFKNLKNMNLTLQDITCLLSVNSYGKSNTLLAILFGIDFIIQNVDVKKNQMAYYPAFPINVHHLVSNFSFEIEADIEGKEVIYGYSFSWGKTGKRGKIMREYLTIKEPEESQKPKHYINRTDKEAFYKPSPKASCSKPIQAEGNELVLNKLKAYDTLYYLDTIKALNDLKIFADHDFNATHSYESIPVLKGESLLYDLEDRNNIPVILYDIKKKRPNHYQLILNTFMDIFPSIEKIDAVEVSIREDNNALQTNPMSVKTYAIIAKDKNLEAPIKFNDMSVGAKRILKVLTDLEIASYKKFSIVAIEEPENSLNPKILQQYLVALSSLAKGVKIIMTSHSPYLINYVNPSHIYVGVPNDKGLATFAKLKASAINKVMSDASSLDLYVGDYLFDLMSGNESDLETLTKYLEK